MMNKKITWALLLGSTAILVACKEKPKPPEPTLTYTVGGSITGLTSAGLVLSVNGTNVTVAPGASSFASSGAYASGTAYAVTQGTKPATQTCTVTNGTGTVGSTNVSNVAVNCVTDTFSVAATISGLTGAGLVLQLNGGTGMSVTGNGAQTFSNRVDTGSAYAVTVQTQPIAPNQLCTVVNGSGPSISANISDVTVACVNVTTISGVAAVGSPLVGNVSVKDANGVIAGPMPIGSNGAYTVDVAGMTPPFVFRAEGTANGHTSIVHSAAVAADVGGTINITQLTDLVVDNIAGQVASTYFTNGNFSSLTPEALNAEVAILKTRLLPVLTALGVDASIDLLRSRFTPLASALDSALDILRVTLDTTTNIATITNIVTQQSIQDSIVTAAAAEASPPVLTNTGGVGSAAADSDAIKAALASFGAKFATGLPSVGSLELAMTTDFLADDADRARMAAYLASLSGLVGGSFADADIKSIDYTTDPTQPTANVDFTIKGSAGIEYSRVRNWRVRKGADSIWRIHGNQRVMAANVVVHPYRDQSSGCRNTGFEFHIRDENSANNGGVVNHVMVYGPGLPSGGLRYNPSATGGGEWSNTTQGGAGYNLAYSCGTTQTLSDIAIAAIPDNAGYVFVPYSSADNSVRLNYPSGAIASGPYAGMYWANIEKRPPTLAELIASTSFPTITSPDAAGVANYTSGPLPIVVTGVNPNAFVDLILERTTASGDEQRFDGYEVPTSAGTISTSMSLLPAAAGDAITERSVRVASDDAYRRHFMSGYTSRTFGVSGTVTGLTGTLGLNLFVGSGLPGQTLTLNSGATTFTFATALPTNVGFSAYIGTQPAGQTCVVTRMIGSTGSNNITGVTVSCAANVTVPIAGTFVGNIGAGYMVATFTADGTYSLALRHPAADNCRNVSNQLTSNGTEYGIYNWDAGTGAFQALMAPLDTTGSCGFRRDDGAGGYTGTLTRVGGALNFVGTGASVGINFTLNAITSTSGGLLGSYYIGAGRYIVLLADNTYMAVWGMSQPFGVGPTSQVVGIEHGCYTATSTNITTNLSATCTPAGFSVVDTNGPIWFANNGLPVTRTIPYTVTGDTLVFGTAPNTTTVLRILTN